MVAHVCALSGGKDSTALALRLKETEPDLPMIYVCTPTGDELPDMVEHWRKLGVLLGSPLMPVTGGNSLNGLIARWQRLPNHRQRWCTRVLKLEPYYRFLAERSPAVSYVGLRADEESRQGMSFPEVADIKVRFPMREWGWTESDVWSYLDERSVSIPQRTDCARCYHQTLGEWYALWRDHRDLWAEAEAQEFAILAARGRQYTFRNKARDTWPADLAGLRREFESGREPRKSKRSTMCRVCSL